MVKKTCFVLPSLHNDEHASKRMGNCKDLSSYGTANGVIKLFIYLLHMCRIFLSFNGKLW